MADEGADDEGGEAACLLHVVGDQPADAPAHGLPVRIDLGALPTGGASGARWSLPHGGDLDANLVRLEPGDAIGEHVNDEVDVLFVGQTGAGEVVVDGRQLAVGPGVVVSIPKGAARSIAAGADGLSYLSIHRARTGLAVRRR